MAGLTDDEKAGLSEEEIKALEESEEPEAFLDEPTGDDDDKGNEGEEKEVTDDKEANDVDEESKDEEKAAKTEEEHADTKNEQEEKTTDQAAVDAEVKLAEESKKEDAVEIPAPPFVNLEVVEQAEINKLNEEVEGLRKQFDDGEIEYDVLAQRQREVDKVILKNEMAQEINAQSIQGTWQWQQEMFFANNPNFIENLVVNLAFTGVVNQLIHSGDANGLTDVQLLNKAKEIVEEGIGGKKEQISENDEVSESKKDEEVKAKAGAIKTAKAGLTDKEKIPTTLKDIPAAEAQGNDDKWAYLDKLDGAVYQAAIDKLSVAEMEQYAMAR